MARVVVTGGAGFIGSHLADDLVQRGHEVVVVDKRARFLPPSGITSLVGDIRDPRTLEGAFQSAEIVFHLAALASVLYCDENPREAHDVNAQATRNMLAAARRAGVRRVIYASTAAVYGDEPSLPKTEDSTLAPANTCARTKLEGERSVLSTPGIEGVALRLFNVY